MMIVTWRTLTVFDEFLEDAQSLNHDQQIIEHLDLLLIDYERAESQARGILLFHDQGIINRYKQTLSRLYSEFNFLKQVMPPKRFPELNRHLIYLLSHVNQQISLLSQAINQKNGESDYIKNTHFKELILNNIVRGQVMEMKTEENQILEAQLKNEARSENIILLSLGLGDILSFLLLGSVFLLVNQEIQLRQKTEGLLQKFNRDLEKRVKQRTVALKHAELKAKSSESRYKLVFQGADIGIWDWDIRQNRIYMNPLLRKMLGMADQKSVSVEEFFSRLYPSDVPRVKEAIQNHLEHHQPYDIEYQLKTESEGYRYFIARGKVIRDRSGEPMRMVGVLTDITNRKAFEKNLEEARNAAEEANHNKSQFLANMTHELRTPLNAIIGFSEMLMSQYQAGPEGQNTKYTKYAQYIADSGYHLLDLVNDILDVSKIEAGKMIIHPEPTDLQKMICHLLPNMQSLAQVKDIHIETDIDLPKGQLVDLDPVRFKQVLINLIGNAIKFNHQGGKVCVRAFQKLDQNQFLIQIEDTGIGIPKNKIKNLFSEFYQVDASYARKQEGTGLGLAVSQKLVHLHGGNITVQSQEGVGSTFIITMPIHSPLLQKQK